MSELVVKNECVSESDWREDDCVGEAKWISDWNSERMSFIDIELENEWECEQVVWIGLSSCVNEWVSKWKCVNERVT